MSRTVRVETQQNDYYVKCDWKFCGWTEFPNGDPAGEIKCNTIEELIKFIANSAHYTYARMVLFGRWIEIYSSHWGQISLDLLNIDQMVREERLVQFDKWLKDYEANKKKSI